MIPLKSDRPCDDRFFFVAAAQAGAAMPTGASGAVVMRSHSWVSPVPPQALIPQRLFPQGGAQVALTPARLNHHNQLPLEFGSLPNLQRCR